MSIGPKGDGAGLAAEGALHVVDVHVEAQLGLLVELLVAEGALTLSIVTAESANTHQVIPGWGMGKKGKGKMMG